MHTQDPSPMPNAYIITGACGSGKSTYADHFHPLIEHIDLDFIDPSLPNAQRQDIRRSHLSDAVDRNVDFALLTCAPSREKKEYWRALIPSHYNVEILVLDPGRMVALQRMQQRGHHTDLNRFVEHWYKHYSRHPNERQVTTAGIPLSSVPDRRRDGAGGATGPNPGYRGT